jgi:glycosyltransferase involved in cell wall biosynthesis
VFVYLSHVDGCPRVVLDAPPSGLAVVANPVFGIVEQIDDGSTGRLLDDPDPSPDEVAAVVRELLADPEERERLGQNACYSVLAENDPAVIGRRLVSALDRILRERDR